MHPSPAMLGMDYAWHRHEHVGNRWGIKPDFGLVGWRPGIHLAAACGNRPHNRNLPHARWKPAARWKPTA
eukprot:310816-Heterocapsa_arctica.AAC.1